MKTKNVNKLIISIFFTIFFFGLMSTNVAHAQSYSLVNQWNLSDYVINNLYEIEDIAIDPSDNI